ncbi:MAG: hypothetical protein FJW39_07370 [Acidobacteria bacterium]|nr:hypothetical protein [Acidobacteriota bacterium]
MTAAVPVTTIRLDEPMLERLAAHEGPCITMLIPPRHPGAAEPGRATLIAGMIRTAAKELAKLHVPPADLMVPVEEFAESVNDHSGGEGYALFRSPGSFLAASAPDVAEASVTAGPHFRLAPLIKGAVTRQEMFVLGLSRNNVKLYRCHEGRCSETPLPEGVPASVDEATAFDTPDHDLENRSAAGPSTGSMKSVHFGTSSEREKAQSHLRHFFALLDRGLKGLLRDRPLVLAGVHEEAALYKKVAKHANILGPEIVGNAEAMTAAEIGPRALQAAEENYRGLGAAALEYLREQPDRRRARTGVHAVLNAAKAGRVHELIAAEDVEVTGAASRQGQVKEDLVNAAVSETLRYGGRVFMLPGSMMPKGVALAALLRY